MPGRWACRTRDPGTPHGKILVIPILGLFFAPEHEKAENGNKKLFISLILILGYGLLRL
jgi:hypothetical protein